MGATVILKCEICGIEFPRIKAEVVRNARRRRRTFCSKKCAGLGTYANFGDKINRDPKWLIPNNRLDEFSPFKRHLNNIKRGCYDRKKPEWFNITLEDLKNQWDKQKGICRYTGWAMDNPEVSGRDTESRIRTPKRASVDRIDSSKGYEKDNIQFICLIAQYAKNSWPENVIFEFAEAVQNNVKSSN
jgi:endogenous inhibitor of DNA gyrase (YacG/DUF329 family)